jgi:UDP-N-acetylmuramoylalanine--D-glutamate ligase
MRVAIAGYGVEGEENYTYWSQIPGNELTIIDQNEIPGRPIPEGVRTYFAPDAFEHLDGYDLVVRTAGLAPYKIVTDGKIWSGTNEFLAHCPAPIIGVTGSKGKGTTSSLIAAVLEAAGKKVWLVGNIGIPALRVLDQIQPTDIVVYELSSFQLWDAQKSPHVAIVLYIEQEHLDVHRSMEEYVEAKAQITRHQTADDLLIFNAENTHARHIADSSVARKVGYPSEEHAYVRDAAFYYGDQYICDTDVLRIPGKHNIDNAVAAIDAVWPFTQDTAAIADGLHAFTGLPHRIAFVATVNGVDYYDDSIATTPSSAIAALRSFADRQKIIILGGSSKGSDFSELAKEMLSHDVIALLVGAEARHIAEACDAAGFTHYEIIDTSTADAFTQRAAELARPGGVVLLSPAAASFGMFKNYADRGEQFIAAVTRLETQAGQRQSE